MSYPEPSYLGDSGEVSASYRQATGEPDMTYRSGNTVHYLATGRATKGLFGLYRGASEDERAEFFLRHDNHWL